MKLNYLEIPLTSIILAILSVIVPFWSHVEMNFYSSVWAWGLITETNYVQFQVGFMNNTLFLIIGILITLLEVISINILSIITYRIWKNDIDASIVRIYSAISAIILILSPIFLMIGDYMAIIEWSELYTPTFGFIFPFISAFFAFITVILASRYIKK